MSERRPLRTCIGCRAKMEKDKLIRLVSTDSGVEIDPDKNKPGRGAYICGSPECNKRIIKTRALNRAYRKEISADVYKKLEEELEIR